jgi:cytochrome c-type biogenesis protein CcmE
MNGKNTLILSIALVAGALAFLIYTGLNANMVYYYHVDEFITKSGDLGGETIKVNGKVVDGTIQKSKMDYRFQIHGAAAQNRVNVMYHGVVPDTFKDGSDVVVEGKYDPGQRLFHATTLLAKCPTKYEPQQEKNEKKSETQSL